MLQFPSFFSKQEALLIGSLSLLYHPAPPQKKPNPTHFFWEKTQLFCCDY